MSQTNERKRAPAKLDPIKRDLLMQHLKATAARISVPAVEPIRRGDRAHRLPLSWSQERIWFLDQLPGAGAVYHMPLGLRLRGPLREDILRTALDAVVARHEVLRTTFASEDGVPFQVIHPVGACPLRQVDLSDAYRRDKAAAEAAILKIAQDEARLPFALDRVPLVRGTLIRLTPDAHVLLLTMHHIVSDGWSTGLLMQEVGAIYGATMRGLSDPLPALPIQYADFVQWQRGPHAQSVLHSQLDYWKRRLEGAPGMVSLPTDRPRPDAQTFVGATIATRFPASLTADAMRFARARGTTLFAAMLAALQIVLFRWTRQADLVVGTVIAGRTRAEIEPLIGCFMNFLPLRGTIGAAQSAATVFDAAAATIRDAYANQDCPFEKIVEFVNPARNTGTNPLFNVALLLQNYVRAVPFVGAGKTTESAALALTAEPLALPHAIASLDLRFVATESDDGISLACEYNTDLFEAQTIRDVLDAYRACLDTLISVPDTPVSSVAISDDLVTRAAIARRREEKHVVNVVATFTAEPMLVPLEFWMETAGMSADVRLLGYNQVFQALLDPHGAFAANERGINIAMVRLEDWLRFAHVGEDEARAPDDDAQIIRQNADVLINALRDAAGFNRVPLLLFLCPSSAAALSRPDRKQVIEESEARLAQAMHDVRGVYLVDAATLRRWNPIDQWEDTYTDTLAHVPYTEEAYAAMAAAVARKAHALLGIPYKVVVLDCDNTLWRGVCGEVGPDGVELDESSAFLQRFMVEQHDAGMLLCLCSKNGEADVWAVFDRRPDFPLRRTHFVAWRINWERKSHNLRSLADELKLGLDSFVFIDDNPVECAEVSASCPEVLTLTLSADPDAARNLLRDIWAFDRAKVTEEARQRTEQYRSNRESHAARQGAASFEDFLRGLSLEVTLEPAREEHFDRLAELTQRTNQFNLSTIRRNSVDIARVQASEELTCLAAHVSDRFGNYGLTGTVFYRVDGAALTLDSFILSCRVLGKGVEYTLLNHIGRIAREAGCSKVVAPFVRTKRNEPMLKFLDAVADNPQNQVRADFVYEIGSIRAESLPYTTSQEDAQADQIDAGPGVIPLNPQAEERVMRLRRIALELNDARTVLEQLAKRRRASVGSAGEYEPPATATEVALASIWAELLEVGRIGRNDDFFGLGGYSLLAIKMYTRVRDLFGASLPMSQIFSTTTLAAFAKVIDGHSTQQNLLVPLRGGLAETPVFFIHPAGGTIFGYTALATSLQAGWPAYAIQSPEVADEPDAPYDLNTLCRRYADIINAARPDGPLRLAGWSLGGILAFRTAQILETQRRRVEWVTLFDAGYLTDAFDSFEAFLAAVCMRLQADDLILDESLLRTLRRVQVAAVQYGAGLEQTLRDDPGWLTRHGVEPQHLDFLKKQYWLQLKHAELDKAFTPGPLNAALHVVWAEESLAEHGVPVDWLSFTGRPGRSTQTVLPGRHTTVITRQPNIKSIVACWQKTFAELS